MIPFVDLAAQHAALKEEIDAAIDETVTKSAFIRGEALERFEAAFAEVIGASHALGVASGTDALNLAVRSLDLDPEDEVITVDNTWISTAFAATLAGARIVLVDIDPATYQMDLNSLERAITPRTKAVIPVHLFGHPAPMPEIVQLCRSRGIHIIEDVAQAPLAEIDGQQTGTFGDVACYSFYPSKNLGAMGDGGAVVTNNGALARKMRRLADYGQDTRYHHADIGFNSRLDTVQAAILNVKLKHLRDWTGRRRRNAEIYNDLLSDLPVKRPSEDARASAVYHLYVIEVDGRDRCLEYLRSQGVMAQVHYPSLIHSQPCYEDLGYTDDDFPAANRAVNRILSLPMYAELRAQQMESVVATLAQFVSSNRS